VLDLRLIREKPELIKNGLNRRGLSIDLTLLQVDSQNLKKIEELRSNLQAKSNQIGKEVGEEIKSGHNPNSSKIKDLKLKGNEIKKEVSQLEVQEKILSSKIKAQLLTFPNIPSEESPLGKDEQENKEIRRWGKPLEENNLLEHWQIGNDLKLFESEKSNQIAKSRFITLFNEGARLERALINFMLDIHTSNGYQEVLPPVLVNSSCLTGSGQLPKFAEESFKCSDDDLWLTPTAEVPLTALHKDEIIPFEELPIRYVAYSPCFRREAGSYGRDTKGLIRLHQFNKVELYWFTHPRKSAKAHEQLTADAESILQALELPYRVIELCTGDLGFSASRTYDLEVWLAGAKKYREISSCSLCTDFQARRSSIRTKEDKKTKLVHTLNGSGLAIGRTMAAIIENGQQPDGSVNLPKALIPYFGKSTLKRN
tara:strand:- start:1766 stop:3043 length:1278 start_codon:yes stop_codon:yes gene_type:complete